MVRHTLHGYDLHAVFSGNLTEDGGTTSGNPTFQHLPPVLRAKHDVVLIGVNDVVVRLVSGNHVCFYQFKQSMQTT